MIIHNIVLLQIISGCFCESFVKRRTQKNSLTPINIFSNEHNLCNKGYCETRNAGSNGFNYCECQCKSDKTFFSKDFGCLSMKEIREKLKDSKVLELGNKFTVSPSGIGSDTVTIVSSTEEIDHTKLTLRSKGTGIIDMNTCNCGTIYYLAYDGDVRIYNKNFCQEVLAIEREKKDNFLYLKWKSTQNIQWLALNGHLILVEVICSLLSGSEQMNTLMLLQVAGKFNSGTKPSSAAMYSTPDILCKEQLTETHSHNNGTKSFQEKSSNNLSPLLLGLIIGLLFVIIIVLIISVVIYYIVKKKSFKFKIRTFSRRKTTVREENNYVLPTTPLSLTEDLQGYLLPSDCGITKEEESSNREYEKYPSIDPSIDEDGYVSLKQFQEN